MSKVCKRCHRRLCKKQFVWADRYGNDKEFRNCKYCKMNRDRWRGDNFTYKMIDACRYKDSGKRVGEGRTPKDFTWDENDYITREYIILLRTFQDDRCAYCDCLMQTLNRNLPDGMTLEALDSTKPHVRSNCCLACKLCNTSRIGQRNMKVGEAVGLKHLAAGLENLHQQKQKPQVRKKWGFYRNPNMEYPDRQRSMSSGSSSEGRILFRHRKDRRSASYV